MSEITFRQARPEEIETVLRLLPPFIIGREQIDDFLGVLDGVLGEVAG